MSRDIRGFSSTSGNVAVPVVGGDLLY